MARVIPVISTKSPHLWIIWLVVWNIFFIFPYIGNTHPNWLFIFQRGRYTTKQLMYSPAFSQLSFIFGKGPSLQCEAPKIAKLVYNSNNYGLWYANNYSYWGESKPTNITGGLTLWGTWCLTNKRGLIYFTSKRRVPGSLILQCFLAMKRTRSNETLLWTITELWQFIRFISYNWLFLWDYTFYKWGDLVLITGKGP